MYNLKIIGKGGILWIIRESSYFPNEKLTIGNYPNKRRKK